MSGTERWIEEMWPTILAGLVAGAVVWATIVWVVSA